MLRLLVFSFRTARTPRFAACLLMLAFAGCVKGAESGSTWAAACTQPDNVTRVRGGGLCLVIKTFGLSEPANVPVLFIVLHGDTSGGGPSTYHYVEAKRLENAAPPGSVAVAMIRPGYFDDQGNTSGGLNYYRRDNYTPANIAAIADAIRTLKARYGARRVVLVGHSGGAAISGVILGKYPHLADAAVLVSCPCDIHRWRAMENGRPWLRSESPSSYVGHIPAGARIVAVTGAMDTNTPAVLAEQYVSAVTAHGVSARFVLVPGATHNASFRSPLVIAAAQDLAQGN